jgi:hypothetical protein
MAHGSFHIKAGQKIEFRNPPPQIFTKFLPVVPIIENRKNAKFQLSTPNGSKVMTI